MKEHRVLRNYNPPSLIIIVLRIRIRYCSGRGISCCLCCRPCNYIPGEQICPRFPSIPEISTSSHSNASAFLNAMHYTLVELINKDLWSGIISPRNRNCTLILDNAPSTSNNQRETSSSLALLSDLWFSVSVLYQCDLCLIRIVSLSTKSVSEIRVASGLVTRRRRTRK